MKTSNNKIKGETNCKNKNNCPNVKYIVDTCDIKNYDETVKFKINNINSRCNCPDYEK